MDPVAVQAPDGAPSVPDQLATLEVGRVALDQDEKEQNSTVLSRYQRSVCISRLKMELDMLGVKTCW